MKNPYINNEKYQEIGKNNLNFDGSNFLKGLLIGAAATYLLTNKNAMDTLMKSAVKMQNLLQVGMEELKERYEDAKAEISE